MPQATHAITIDGHTSMEAAAYDVTVEATIERAVRIIDGDRHFAVSLWALPPGMPLDRVQHSDWPQEYIQATGEGSRRLTAEVRRRDDAGGYEQLVIGRPGAEGEAPSETISCSAARVTVAPSEVLTADEVVDLFVAYYRSGSVPPAVSRRRLVAPARRPRA